MKQMIFILLSIILIAGCNTPGNPPPVSRLDIAIENLSRTTLQLEDLRKEKEFFSKSLADFERQEAEYGAFMDPNKIDREERAFAKWHRDIAQREKDLNIEHSTNVLAAHREILKRKTEGKNPTALSVLQPRNP